MNWRLLFDLATRRRAERSPDRFERMAAVVRAAHADPAIGRPRVIAAEPKWSKFVLLRDAKGRSLMQRAWSKLRRVA